MSIKSDLPADSKDRFVFCLAYGDYFNGENHEEALSFARFAVSYKSVMRLPPYDKSDNELEENL